MMAQAHEADAGGEASGFLSVAQVARRLGCSVSLVQKWRRLRWLPATRLGPPEVPVYGYLPADVERFAREQWNRRRGRPPGSRTSGRTVVIESAPAAPATGSAPPERPAPANAVEASSTRPLVLWDGDPASGTALVLGRFGPAQWEEAVRVAEMWARRYAMLTLAESAGSGEEPRVLAQWQNGERLPLP